MVGSATATEEEMRKWKTDKQRARRMIRAGKSRSDVAALLGYDIDFVSRLRSEYKKRTKIYNPHAPDDDECNVKGFAVPSPEEIAHKTALMRSGALIVERGSVLYLESFYPSGVYSAPRR